MSPYTVLFSNKYDVIKVNAKKPNYKVSAYNQISQVD